MMKTKFFTAMTTFFILAFIGQASAVSFKNRNFKGDYGYLSSGSFTRQESESPFEAAYSETGVLKPDGNGNLEAGPFKAIVGGSLLFSGYSVGTYSVDADGLVQMNLQFFDNDDNLLAEGANQGVLSDKNRQVRFYTVPASTRTENSQGVAFKQ